MVLAIVLIVLAILLGLGGCFHRLEMVADRRGDSAGRRRGGSREIPVAPLNTPLVDPAVVAGGPCSLDHNRVGSCIAGGGAGPRSAVDITG